MPTDASPPPPDGTGRPDADSSTTDEALRRLQRLGAATRAKGGELQEWVEQHRSSRPVLDLGLRLHERDREAAGTIAGSALAFRLFLFFVPVLLVLVGLAGFLSALISADDAAELTGISGALAGEIEEAFAQSSTARWSALLAGLWGVAFSGRSLAKAFVLMSALSWRVPPTGHRATVRVTGVVVGMMLSLALCAVVVNLVLREYGVLLAGLSLTGVAIAYFLAWLTLSATLPRSTPDPGALLPGAALMGATMALLQAFTQLYLPSRFEQASSLYGGLGVTVVTLGWFFIVGRLAVLTMTINAVVYERFGSLSTLVFALPVVRALPARSPRVREIFGLDDAGRSDDARR